MDLTLVELHLEDASFTAHAPFSGRGDGGEAPEASEPNESGEAEAEGPDILPFLIGLAALAALAYLLRRRWNGGTEPVPDETEPAVSTA